MANHSFRITLSPRQIARASRPGGFPTSGQIGEYDTAIASIAKRADEVYFLKEGNFEADKKHERRSVTGYDRSSAGARALATAADCSTSDGLASAGLRPDTRQIRNLCAIKRNVVLSLYHDANRQIYCVSCTISYATAAVASRWFTFPTTVWPLKSAAKTCNTLPMMISISKISRCLLWSFPATIKRIG